MKRQFNFVAISGSLRVNSYNTMVLKVLQKIAPENIVIEHLSVASVPFYNYDLHQKDFPHSVEELTDKIKKSDAVIFVTPEYNYSVPGVLKNAIDIISRSPQKPFDMKPVGIIGASTGMLGTARAQYHLRQIMVFVNAYVMNQPEIMIANAADKFDENGNLKDEKTLDLIRRFIESLADFSTRFNHS